MRTTRYPIPRGEEDSADPLVHSSQQHDTHIQTYHRPGSQQRLHGHQHEEEEQEPENDALRITVSSSRYLPSSLTPRSVVSSPDVPHTHQHNSSYPHYPHSDSTRYNNRREDKYIQKQQQHATHNNALKKNNIEQHNGSSNPHQQSTQLSAPSGTRGCGGMQPSTLGMLVVALLVVFAVGYFLGSISAADSATRAIINSINTNTNTNTNTHRATTTTRRDSVEKDTMRTETDSTSAWHAMDFLHPPPITPNLSTVWCLNHEASCLHNKQQHQLYQQRVERLANTTYTQRTCAFTLSSPVKLFINDQRFDDWGYGPHTRQQALGTCHTPCALTKIHSDAHILLYVQSLLEGFHPLLPNQSSAVVLMEAFEGTAWKPSGFDNRLLTAAVDFVIGFDRRSDIWVSYHAELHGRGLIHKDQWACDRGECFTDPIIPFSILNQTHTAYSAIYIANCAHAQWRTKYLTEIMALIPIDSYGACLHTPGLPEPDRAGGFDRMFVKKREISSEYLFVLIMENWIKDDYVTEKYFQALLFGGIPVYLGATNIAQYYPAQHSVINIHDFHSVRQLVRYMQYLRQNEQEYETWRDWRRQHPVQLREDFVKLRHWSIGGWEEDSFACHLCIKYEQRYCKAVD